MTDPEQRTPAWFEARKSRVTGSIVGAILGLAPYMKRSDAMRLMVREALGADREFDGNIATEHGRHYEPGALVEFQMESGLRVRPAPFITSEDWLGASPDGFTSDNGLVEIKCPFGKRKDAAPEFKSIADQPHYYAQMQVQMYVASASCPSDVPPIRHCHFYQWAPNGTMVERVDYDQAWLDDNLPALRQFYAEFLHERDSNAAEHLAPKRVEIDTVEAAKMVAEWDDIAEAIERLSERKADLLEAMANIAGGKDANIGGRRLTKVDRAGSIAYGKVVKDHCKGVDLEQYRGKASSYWQFK